LKFIHHERILFYLHMLSVHLLDVSLMKKLGVGEHI
jgi:hypothetical protein